MFRRILPCFQHPLASHFILASIVTLAGAAACTHDSTEPPPPPPPPPASPTIALSITGIPAGRTADIRLIGPNGQRMLATADTVLRRLSVGTWRVVSLPIGTLGTTLRLEPIAGEGDQSRTLRNSTDSVRIQVDYRAAPLVTPPPEQRFPYVVAPLSGLGVGYDAVQAEVRNNICLELTPTDTTAVPIAGSNTYYGFDEMTSEEERSKQLKISVGAKLNIGIFNHSVDFQKVTQTSLSSFRKQAVFTVRVENVTRKVITPRFSATALAKLRQGAAPFLLSCGTHYIAGMIWGGAFRAVLTVQQDTSRLYSQLGVTLSSKVSQLKGGSGVTAGYEQIFTSLAAEGHVTAEVWRLGTADSIPDPTLAAAFEQYALSFPPRVQSGSAGQFPLDAIAQSYLGVDLSGCGEDYWICQKNLQDAVATPLGPLDEYGTALDTVNDVLGELEGAIESSGEFYPRTAAAQASTFKAEVEATKTRLQQDISACLADPSTCHSPTVNFPSGLPIRKQWVVVGGTACVQDPVLSSGPANTGNVALFPLVPTTTDTYVEFAGANLPAYHVPPYLGMSGVVRNGSGGWAGLIPLEEALAAIGSPKTFSPPPVLFGPLSAAGGAAPADVRFIIYSECVGFGPSSNPANPWRVAVVQEPGLYP